MLISNSVRCNHCDTEIYSSFRHDFQGCMCKDEDKKVYVDGGMEYGRRVYGKDADFIDLSISVPNHVVAEMIEAIEDKRKNSLGRICNLSRVLRDYGVNISMESTE